jgi:hypothetical protein
VRLCACVRELYEYVCVCFVDAHTTQPTTTLTSRALLTLTTSTSVPCVRAICCAL